MFPPFYLTNIYCLLSVSHYSETQPHSVMKLTFSGMAATFRCLLLPHPTGVQLLPPPAPPPTVYDFSGQTGLRPQDLFIPTSQPLSHQLALVLYLANSRSPSEAQLHYAHL